jgi:hypothetical protein
MEVSGELHTPATLPQRKEPPWYALDRRLGGPQSHSGCGGEEMKKSNKPLSLFNYTSIINVPYIKGLQHNTKALNFKASNTNNVLNYE